MEEGSDLGLLAGGAVSGDRGTHYGCSEVCKGFLFQDYQLQIQFSC